VRFYFTEEDHPTTGHLYRPSDDRSLGALSRSLAARTFPGRF
jgi:hypothetical protein